MKVTVEHLSLPKEGERLNGDAVVVHRYERGTLVSLIDALGHGEYAAAVAKTASVSPSAFVSPAASVSSAFVSSAACVSSACA